MARDTDTDLIIRMEATLAKFEKQMAKAHQTSVKTATAIQGQFDTMGNRMGSSAAKGAAGLSKVVNISGAGRFVLQNTAAQLGDIAVQLEGGTGAMRVMGQQMPQILGGFGALGGALGLLGPLLGTVAAVGFPIAGMLLAMGDSADDTAEKVQSFAEKLTAAKSAIDAADAAMSLAGRGGAADLKEIYGEVTKRVTDLADALAEIERRAATIKVDAVLDEATGAGLRDKVDALLGTVGGALASAGTAENAEMIKAQEAVIEQLRTQIQTLETLGQSVPSALRDTYQAAQEELAALQGRFEDIGALGDQLSVSPEVVASWGALEARLQSARSAGDFSGVADVLSQMRETLRQMGVDLDDAVVQGLVQAEDTARQMAAKLDAGGDAAANLANSASGVAPHLAHANSEAGVLVGNLREAMAALNGVVAGIRAAQRKSLALARVRQETIGDPVARAAGEARVDFNERSASAAFEAMRTGNFAALKSLAQTANDIADGAAEVAAAEQALRQAEQAYAKEIADARRGGAGRGGGRVGGRGGAARSETPFFERTDQQIERLQREIDMMGRTQSEVAGLTAKYRLLDEAKARGLDLDRQSQRTGQSLRQEIDAQAEAIARLTEQKSEAAERARFLEEAHHSLRDGFLDAIIEGQNLAGVLADLAKKLARAALEAALFGSGPFASGGAVGGGLLGGLFGSLMSFDGGGFTGKGARVGGIDGKGGFPAIVHPNETVIDHTKLSRRSGPTGLHVTVSMQQDGNLMAVVRDEAGRVLASARPHMLQEAVGASVAQVGERARKEPGYLGLY